MSELRKIRILGAFNPFLRLLNAQNFDNFRDKNLRDILRGIFFAFTTSSMIFIMPFVVALNVWHFIEVRADFGKIAVAFPLLASVMQTEIICIVLTIKSRTVTNTINRLQEIIDQRKFLFKSPMSSVDLKITFSMITIKWIIFFVTNRDFGIRSFTSNLYGYRKQPFIHHQYDD